MQPRPASVPHLYWHFLMYQNHLDRAAAAHEKQGKDGKWLRNHLQQRLGFTDSQFAPIRTSAQRLEPQVVDIRAKAMVIVKADRAWAQTHPEARRTRLPVGDPAAAGEALRSAPPTPGRAQLHQLQQQHEAAIQHEMEALKTALGPELAAKLDNFIQNDWTRQVTAVRVQPGLLRNFRTPVRREAQP
jgi:hypothetical protein